MASSQPPRRIAAADSGTDAARKDADAQEDEAQDQDAFRKARPQAQKPRVRFSDFASI